VPKLAVSAKTGMVAIVAIAAKIVPLVKWVDRLNNMVMLLDQYCEFTKELGGAKRRAEAPSF
jgi:hypothetical protein